MVVNGADTRYMYVLKCDVKRQMYERRHARMDRGRGSGHPWNIKTYKISIVKFPKIGLEPLPCRRQNYPSNTPGKEILDIHACIGTRSFFFLEAY